MSILERVKQLCSENKISIHKMETDLGFGNRTVYKWATASPSIDKVKAVADYFGVSVDYLLNEEDTQEEEKSLEQILQDAFEARPEMRMLFSISQNATKEEVEQAIRIIEALKK